MISSFLPKKWDYETDVLVVGAGNAGLTAAITARDIGVKVGILESMPYCASSLALTEVGPAFAGTDIQKEQGIIDSPEDFFNDGMERAKGTPELWRLFADHQLDTYNWCKSLGLPFRKLFAPPGHKAKRAFFIKGDAWLKIIEANARDRGADILFLHRAMRLIVDPQTSKISGVQVRVGDKIKYFKSILAVILATGGFGRNKDMVTEYGPDYIDCIPIMPPGHLGDGINMALDIGAATKGIGIAIAPSYPIDESSKSGNMAFITYGGGIFVNVDGKRFWDEGTRESYYGVLSEEGLRQPGGNFWVIYDENIRKRVVPSKFGKSKSIQANTIEKLADKTGLNAKGLKETIDKYNNDIENFGYDTVFDRRTLVGVDGTPVKIEKPPFYSIKCAVSTTSCKGGLKVNTRLQVMDRFDEAIPGLYACGEVMGGLWGANGIYLPCTTISAALTFGRIAGRNAATGL